MRQVVLTWASMFGRVEEVVNNNMTNKNDLSLLLDEYLEKRKTVVNFDEETKEYFYGSFFSIFQKSYAQKREAVTALKQALNGEKVDLSEHLSTLRNGTLGNELRGFVKSGMANTIAGEEVNTVSDFVQALQYRCSNVI